MFLDVDSISLGRDFRQALHERLETCDAFLALIGPGWLDAKDQAGKRRLDDLNDYLRQEIAVALVRNIPVTPVLVQGATMPAPERLPEDLKELAFRNGFELSHTRWHSDVRELAHRLGLDAVQVTPAETPGKGAPAQPSPPPSGSKGWVTRRRALGAAAIAVAAAGVGVAAPSIRRWLFRPAKPSLRSVSFDYATVDAKGTRLPTEKAAAYLFTEALTSSVGLDMVAIPGGTFLMGSPIYEPERRPNEGPQRQVTVKPFFISASPITQAQWVAVATARPAKTSLCASAVPVVLQRRRPAGRERHLERSGRVLPPPVRNRRARLSPAERSRMGIRLPRRDNRSVQCGTDDHYRTCKLLRSGRRRMRRQQWQEHRVRCL